MKRSRINLNTMRKAGKLGLIGAGAGALAGCDSYDANIYYDVQDCALNNPSNILECQSAYQQALNGWQRTAPRYSFLHDCEAEFGNGECQTHQGLYLPAMAGFMLAADDEFDLDFDRPKPLGRSTNRRSSAYKKWIGAGGALFGTYGKRQVEVSKSTFKPLKGNNKVLGRGGFGKTISSRSRGG